MLTFNLNTLTTEKQQRKTKGGSKRVFLSGVPYFGQRSIEWVAQTTDDDDTWCFPTPHIISHLLLSCLFSEEAQENVFWRKSSREIYFQFLFGFISISGICAVALFHSPFLTPHHLLAPSSTSSLPTISWPPPLFHMNTSQKMYFGCSVP